MALSRDERLRRLRDARLYFVCEGLPNGRDPTPLLGAALRGGADIVQLREKAPRCAEELISLSEPFRRTASAHGALFMLNDRPDLVEACGADGVHVGQDDASVADARAGAGPDAIVGLSTHSTEQLLAAIDAGGRDRPDQVSVGPVWATPTKEGRPATGLGLVEFAARESTIPWFAIGGVDTGNVAQVAGAGAERVVVVRAIRDAEDPEAAARTLRAALPEHAGVVLMADRERKRAERRKRKSRAVERREQMATRYEEKNQAAREKLEPLEQGERPRIVTIGAVISALIAVVFWVSTVLAATGHETVRGASPSPLAVGIIAVLVSAMAWGMWKARYWAVLGFQAFLALAMLSATLGLIQVETVLEAVGTTVVLVVSGTLFYFMIRGMARIQMPERTPRD